MDQEIEGLRYTLAQSLDEQRVLEQRVADRDAEIEVLRRMVLNLSALVNQSSVQIETLLKLVKTHEDARRCDISGVALDSAPATQSFNTSQTTKQ